MTEYLISYPPFLFSAFGILAGGLMLLFYISNAKLRRKGAEKIASLYSELERERHISQELHGIDEDIHHIESDTNQKFLTIRIAIFNIHHTFWEIFH